jgi:hypothetical protein
MPKPSGPIVACKNCGDMFQTTISRSTVNCPTCRTREGRASKRGNGAPPEPTGPEIVPTHKAPLCTISRGDSICGQPSKVAWRSSSGAVYGECERHADPGLLRKAGLL